MNDVFDYVSNALSSLSWEREPAGLYEPIAYTLAAGGKRLRPSLAVIASDMFGGERERVMPAALALEVFHNFTLLHDDVMDHADVRRGRPTVHVRWNEQTAILSGDEMMIEAYRLLENIEPHLLPQILNWFNRMAREICEGQQMDMDFETMPEVTIEQYIEMIRLKTSVLLATALRIGAYIGGAPATDCDLLYEFGIKIGLAFQLQDDWLDVYGSQATFGKAIGGDIVQNKKTWLLLAALQSATGSEQQMLKHWIEAESFVPQEKIDAVRHIYDTLHVGERSQQLIEQYTAQALSILDKVSVSSKAKEPLRQLTLKLLNRID